MNPHLTKRARAGALLITLGKCYLIWVAISFAFYIYLIAVDSIKLDFEVAIFYSLASPTLIVVVALMLCMVAALLKFPRAHGDKVELLLNAGQKVPVVSACIVLLLTVLSPYL